MQFARPSCFVLLCVAAVSAGMQGQATATATAPTPYSQFQLPDIGGELRYSLSAAESVVTGYNGTTGQGANAYTNLSGDLAYLSHNPSHQFSAVYAGGYLFGNSSFPSYAYQSLTVSESLQSKHYHAVIGDTISYLPQTGIGDLSGVPGAGDQGLPAVSVNGSPTLGILTTYATRIGNTVSGSVGRDLTASTSLSLTGAYSAQYYTGSSTSFQGINNSQESVGLSLMHRINERTTVGGQYSFSNSSFSSGGVLATGLVPVGGDLGYQTHSATVLVTRVLSPRLNLSAGVGPQWTASGSDQGLVRGTATNVAGFGSLTYTALRYSAGINYSRGVNNGNGVVIGSEMDTLVANISHPFARIYNVGALVGWNRSTQLSNSTLPAFENEGVVAGGQFGVQVRRSVSVFASYTLQRQNFDGYAPAGIAFNGLTQYASFGVTYSPKPIFRK